MTLEQGAISALAATVAALGYLFGLLWQRSQRCEEIREKQTEQIAALNRAVGLAEGENEVKANCQAPACPWRPPVKAGLITGTLVLVLFALSSCSLPFARNYELSYSPDGKQTVGARVHFDAAPMVRTAGAGDKVIKPPFAGAEPLVVPAR